MSLRARSKKHQSVIKIGDTFGASSGDMRIQIITSSYPKNNNDPSGTAGLFVRDFAEALVKKGHIVVIQPIARKSSYIDNNKKIIIEPIPWNGGDQELASMSISLKNILASIRLLIAGRKDVIDINKKYKIDYVIAMWAVPSGVFAYFVKKKIGVPYDVWALGSDIWRVRKIPFLGNLILKKIAEKARHRLADGVTLASDFRKISSKECMFLPTSRRIPLRLKLDRSTTLKKINLLFVGRYHPNKGPDMLIEAIKLLPKKYQKKINVNFYGLGPLEVKIKQMVIDYNLTSIIKIHGPINLNSLLKELKIHDYLVIPSRIESIPIIFSDAIQSGTPVITTPVGDLKKLIHKYKCGLCAETVTPESMAKSILNACMIKPIHFNNGIKQAQNVFNISKIADKWLKLSK